MTEQHRTTQAKRTPKQQQKSKQAAIMPAQIVPEELFTADDNAVQLQADRLGDPRLKSVQKQQWAAQIGRVQGNKHLQRVMDVYGRPLSKSSAFGQASPVQRHAIAEAPPPIEEEEKEEIQTKSLLQRRTDKTQAFFGRADVERTDPIQRWKKGVIPGGKTDTTPAPKWQGATPGGKKAPAGGPKLGAERTVKFGPVTFKPSELVADGVTTTRAAVSTTPAGREVKWSIFGQSYGSSIDDKGVITPGRDTGGLDWVWLLVKATDATATENYTTGVATLWNAKYHQAKKDYDNFVAGRYQFPKFKTDNNFGRFDVDYQPALNRVDININVKFAFPDDQPVVGETKKVAKERKTRQTKYRQNFIGQVTNAWSGRYEFKNVREPQTVWGKLNPTTVKVNVNEVKKDQHFLINVNTKTEDTANVTATGEANFFKGDDTPQKAFPNTGANEVKRVKKVTPTIRFDNGKADIPVKYHAPLDFLATYLKRINNPQFKLEITGHASAIGKKALNQTLSEKRAQAVKDKLTGAGLSNHILTSKGEGATGASILPGWRKVVITPSLAKKGWENFQDVTAHEFGHMIGLDDEYDSGRGPITDHYALVKKAFGQKYADKVAKVNVGGVTDQASVMEGGNDVRIYHYVTFWDALVKTTLNKAPLPNPKFGYDDWKFIG